MSAVSPAATRNRDLLVGSSLSKSYERIPVLTKVDIRLAPAEVLGIAGENGAGKSTLLNILSGVVPPDGGELRVRGHRVHLHGYRSANEHGIFRVFQEPALVPHASVYENVFLSHERRFARFGVLRRSQMAQRAGELLESLGQGRIDPRASVATYDLSLRRVIEIVKAFAMAEFLEVSNPILLLDEPTAGLEEREKRFIQSTVEQLRARAGIIFVSHDLTELLSLSDRVMVMRDGQLTGHGPASGYTNAMLHELMVGRSRSEHFYREDRQHTAPGAPVLRVEGLSETGAFRDVSFTVAAGEVLGLAGLLGSGRSEVGRAIWGASRRTRGTVQVDGRLLRLGSIAASLEARMAYVPGSRAEALMPGLSVAWNTSLFRLNADRTWSGMLLRPAAESQAAEEHVRLLNIRTAGIRAPVRSLSGGNQQKVILARCLAVGVRVLILDSPTRGVDVGAKEELYSLLRNLTDQGTAILLISDELPEVIGVSNRLLVMREGQVVMEIAAPADRKPSEIDVFRHLVGGRVHAGPATHRQASTALTCRASPSNGGEL